LINVNKSIGKLVPQKEGSRFRGTVKYASLNAHNKIVIFLMRAQKKKLSRRDDLWSFYFILLEMFGVQTTWAGMSDGLKVAAKFKKQEALENPEKFLWLGKVKKMQEMKNIFNELMKYKYEDKPNYAYIKEQLFGIIGIAKEKTPMTEMITPQKRQLENNSEEDNEIKKKLIYS